MNENELDAVRLRLYEETKNMTPTERVAYLRKLATQVHKEFGITPKPTPMRKAQPAQTDSARAS